MLSHVFSMILGLASTAILSRYLGVDAFGQLNYLYAFYYFFMMLCDFGVDVVVIREVSQKLGDADRVIGAIRTLKLFISVIALAGAWFTILFMNFPQPLDASLKIFGLILPIIALQTPSLIFPISLKMEYGAMVGLVNRTVNFALTVFLVAYHYKLRAFAFAAILCEIVSLGLILYFSRHDVRPKWTVDFSIYKKIFRSSIPIALTGIFVAIINRIDFIMLERMTNIHEVGLYSANYKIINIVQTLPSMMMATIFPLMSRYASSDIAALKRVYRKSNLLLTSVAIPMGMVITFAAPLLTNLFFGAAFIQSYHGLRTLIWASVFLYMALPAGHLLISTGHEKIGLFLNMTAAVMNIGLNCILIPKMSFVGAGIATSVSYFFLMAGSRFFVWKILRDRKNLPDLQTHE